MTAGSEKAVRALDETGCAVGESSASDTSIYEQIVQPFVLFNTPLTRDNFAYHINYLQTPLITLYREQFDSRCRVRGLSPPDALTVAVPLHVGPDSAYWKAPWCQSGLPATMPGGVDVMIGAEQAHLIIQVNLSLLRGHLPTEISDSLDRAARNRLLPVAAVDVERFGRWLLTLLEQTSRQPHLFQYPAVVRSIEEDLLYQLTNVVQLPSMRTTGNNRSKQHSGLGRALEYLRVTDLSTLTIPQLSEAACVSLKTLENVFRTAFELTPLGFIRLQRFHAARHKLMAAAPQQMTVTHVAHDSGFYHLGRFSANYRHLFGELPSETLLQYYRPPQGPGLVHL